MKQTAKGKALLRLNIARNVKKLLHSCLIASNRDFPQLGPKIRSALKSAGGAVRNAECKLGRFE